MQVRVPLREGWRNGDTDRALFVALVRWESACARRARMRMNLADSERLLMRQIPYPADTRAKGWRFELDMERARQSDTWTLAPADVRPWLLMLWAVAWEQTPCGSLPADDLLIAARIGMPLKLFQRHKAVLMRRWWLAEDGRLYHDVLVARALEMLEERAKTARRVATSRALMREQRASNALQRSSTPLDTTPEPEPVLRNTPLPPTGGVAAAPPVGRVVEPGEPSEPIGCHEPTVQSGEGRFPEFWAAWPRSERKVDRKKCLAKWRRSRLDARADAIIAHVIASRATQKWRDGYEPAPMTYLNGERWADGGGVADSAQPPTGREGFL